MTQSLDLVISAKNATDAAFGKLTEGQQRAEMQMRRLQEQANEMNESFGRLSEGEQRAAMKMERLHEEALKMNAGFKSSDDGAQLFSQTLGKATGIVGAHEKSINRLASAYGLPAVPISQLSAAVDVTSLGFGQLTKSAVGFNAASVGVVGAGVAIGTTIGSLLREIPAVAKMMDDWAESVLRLAGVQVGFVAATGDVAKMSAIQAQVQQNVINLMKSQGKTTDEIVAQLTGKHVPAIDKVVDALRKEDEAKKKSAEATRKAKDAYEDWILANAKAETQAQKEWMDKQAKDAEALAEATKKAEQQTVALMLAIVKSTEQATKSNDEFFKRWEQVASDAAKRILEGMKEEDKARKKQADDRKKHLQDLARDADGVASIFSGVGDLFVALGGNADSMFTKILDGFAGLASTAANVLSQWASGNFLGAIGAGLSGLAGVFGSVFGDKEHEKVNDMRDAFVEAAGGITALDIKARAAGMTLDQLLAAKKVKDYEAAVRDLEAAWARADEARERALALQNEAQEKLNAAIERYGFTVDELGPKFAQQKLDEQFAQLYEDWQLLNAAGVDHTAIIERMGPAINDYVSTAIKAGATIPEAFRPVVEQMIAEGKLLDENGDAFESVEAAGIHFAESLTEGISKLIDKITSLVNALLGIPDKDVNVNLHLNDPDGALNGGDGGGKHPGGGGGGGGKNNALGGWFPYRGGGYDAGTVGEAGDEAIVPRQELVKMFAQAMAMAGGSHRPSREAAAQLPVVQVFIGADQLVPTFVRLKEGGYLG